MGVFQTQIAQTRLVSQDQPVIFFFDGCGPEKVHHSIPQGSQLMFRQETLEIKKSKPRAMRLDFGLVGVPCKVPPQKKLSW